MATQQSNIFQTALKFLQDINPFQSTTTYTQYRPSTVQAAQSNPTQTPTSSPVAAAQQMLPQQGGDFSPESLKQAISQTYGQDTPILNNVNDLYQAGLQFKQAGLDPYLPTILSLRETQGGKDLSKRDFGKNNPYNIRGDQNGQRQFINYPDIHTATLGGQNEYSPGNVVTAQGLTGLLLNDPIYADFRQSKNIADLFSHYSPPKDNNGPLTGQNIKDPITGKGDQIFNYNWIRNRLTGG